MQADRGPPMMIKERGEHGSRKRSLRGCSYMLKSGVRDAELLTDGDGAPVRWRPDVEGLEGLPADLRGKGSEGRR